MKCVIHAIGRCHCVVIIISHIPFSWCRNDYNSWAEKQASKVVLSILCLYYACICKRALYHMCKCAFMLHIIFKYCRSSTPVLIDYIQALVTVHSCNYDLLNRIYIWNKYTIMQLGWTYSLLAWGLGQLFLSFAILLSNVSYLSYIVTSLMWIQVFKKRFHNVGQCVEIVGV